MQCVKLGQQDSPSCGAEAGVATNKGWSLAMHMTIRAHGHAMENNGGMAPNKSEAINQLQFPALAVKITSCEFDLNL